MNNLMAQRIASVSEPQVGVAEIGNSNSAKK
jgi:hypothetical protein